MSGSEGANKNSGSSAPPFKITIFKNELGAFEDEDQIGQLSQSMEESNYYSENSRTSTGSTFSPNSSLMLESVPFPTTATYEANTTSSGRWNPDDYIENTQGHVAQPRVKQTPLKGTESTFFNYDTTEESQTNQYFTSHQTSIGLSPVVLGALAYFFAWVGALAVIIFEKKNLFVIFHGYQSLISGTFAFIVQFLFLWSSTMYTLLWLAYLIFEFYMIWRIFQDAPSQRLYKLPIIGDWCEQRALTKIQLHSGTGHFFRFA